MELEKTQDISDVTERNSFIPCEEVLCELIFKELSASDLLNLSLVSRKFYNLIGNSPTAMDKIQIKIRETSSREFRFKDFEYSTRQYAHISIDRLQSTRYEVRKLLQKFAGCAKTLFTRYDFDVPGVTFPMLESLFIYAELPINYVKDGLLLMSSSLKKLVLVGQSRYPEDIMKCLENNPGLQELSLEGSSQLGVFEHFTNELCQNLQLKSLKFTSFKDFTRYQELKFFICSQVHSLETFTALEFPFEEMSMTYEYLGNLKRLTYSPPTPNYPRFYKMKVNKSIVELNLINIQEEMLLKFLNKTPNLKKLYIPTPTWRMFDFATYKAPMLGDFSYISFTDINFVHSLGDARDHLVIQQNKGRDVNNNLKIYKV